MGNKSNANEPPHCLTGWELTVEFKFLLGLGKMWGGYCTDKGKMVKKKIKDNSQRAYGPSIVIIHTTIIKTLY